MKRVIKDHINGPARTNSTKRKSSYPLSLSSSSHFSAASTPPATLSLAKFYQKSRDWDAPFPVTSTPTLLQIPHDFHDLSSYSGGSPRISTSSDDEHHDQHDSGTSPPFTPYDHQQVYPELSPLETYTHEPTIVPSQSQGELHIDPDAAPFKSNAFVTPARPFLRLDVPESVPPMVSEYTPDSEISMVWPIVSQSEVEGASSAPTMVSPDWQSDPPVPSGSGPQANSIFEAYLADSEQAFGPSSSVYYDGTLSTTSSYIPSPPTSTYQYQDPLSPEELYHAPQYVYQLPLAMNTPGFRAFSEWHTDISRFTYRFIPRSELTPFEMSEFVFGSGNEHAEAVDATLSTYFDWPSFSNTAGVVGASS